MRFHITQQLLHFRDFLLFILYNDKGMFLVVGFAQEAPSPLMNLFQNAQRNCVLVLLFDGSGIVWNVLDYQLSQLGIPWIFGYWSPTSHENIIRTDCCRRRCDKSVVVITVLDLSCPDRFRLVVAAFGVAMAHDNGEPHVLMANVFKSPMKPTVDKLMQSQRALFPFLPAADGC